MYGPWSQCGVFAVDREMMGGGVGSICMVTVSTFVSLYWVESAAGLGCIELELLLEALGWWQ